MKHAVLALITTTAVVLTGCSSNNDLTGPSTTPGPETLMDAQSAAANDAMSASVGIESNDWKKADVIFPRGTRSIRFHLDDPYTSEWDPNVHVSLSLDGQHVTFRSDHYYDNDYGTYVYPDKRTQVGPNAPVNTMFYFYPERDGAYWTLRIKCDKVAWSDSLRFTGLNGVLHIDDPFKSPRSVTVRRGDTYKIKFAVAAK